MSLYMYNACFLLVHSERGAELAEPIMIGVDRRLDSGKASPGTGSL